MRKPEIQGKCANCGSLPAERAKRDDYQELHTCPHCESPKCSMCDMGDDVSCGSCPDVDE